MALLGAAGVFAVAIAGNVALHLAESGRPATPVGQRASRGSRYMAVA